MDTYILSGLNFSTNIQANGHYVSIGDTDDE